MKKLTLLFTTFSAILLAGCNHNSGNAEQTITPKTPEELREELKIQEQSEAAKYLVVSGATMTHNQIRESSLFRDAEFDGWLVQGVIKNEATVARFKDIVLTISLISPTETVIEEKDYIIYEVYEPGITKNFSIKIYPPEATEKFRVNVKSATPKE